MKKIALDNPCHVSAEKLSQVSGGHYCADCQKSVVDYSNMSDGEMLMYITLHGLGCGQFRDDQLNRELQPTKTKKKLNLFYYLPVLMALLFKAPQIVAQAKADTVYRPIISNALGGQVIMQDHPKSDSDACQTTTRRFGGAVLVCNNRPVIVKHYRRYSLFWGLIKFKIRQRK